MVDVEKRYFAKPWNMHDETSLIKQKFYGDHLPPLKPINKHSITDKGSFNRHPKLHAPSLLPPVHRRISSTTTSMVSSALPSSTTTVEPPTSSVNYSSAVQAAAQRFLLRNSMAAFSQGRLQTKRASLYSHVQARIDTGLPRPDVSYQMDPAWHQLGPVRPLNWLELKRELEHDSQIRAHTKRMQYQSGVTNGTQMTSLGDLIRSKVKSYIASASGSGDERYKIVVHLTVFQAKAIGLHVASRCLWNTRTDNSITLKLQGMDCDILIVIFLCYTDLGSIQ